MIRLRDAIDSTFTTDSVERRHKVALAAFAEGFISLGKLAEALGVDLLTARNYLQVRGIDPQTQMQTVDEIMADAANA
jgi:predicted HTH domain antitoxin